VNTVGNDIGALDAARNLGLTQTRLAMNLAKLSSGLRINSAADDPAGLVISEQMRAQIGSLEQQIKNTDHAINKYQTAGHAAGQLQNSLVELRSLAVAAANEGLNGAAASEAYQTVANNLINAYNRGVDSAQFGTQALLDGSEGAVATVDYLGDMDLSTAEAAQAAIQQIDQAIQDLGRVEGDIGATVSTELTASRNSLAVTLQNLTAAESTIRDTDYALETAKMVRNLILQNAGVAVLAQAGQSAQNVLGLLNE